jgi:hypothetical protein
MNRHREFGRAQARAHFALELPIMEEKVRKLGNGLAAFRNALGDAHGKKPAQAAPAPRHADLAVNLAGSMAAFLLQTYENRFAARS